MLGVDRAFDCGSLSKFFQQSDGIWYVSDTEMLVSKLLTFASRYETKPIVIPTNDHYVEFIIDKYIDLSDHFHISKSYADLAGKLLDKLAFHSLCIQHGVDAPRVWRLTDPAGLNVILDDITFPCIVKPCFIHIARPYMQGKKVFIAANHQQLQRIVENLPVETGRWLVQEIIPGEESRITLLAGYAGKSASANEMFTARKLRQFPPGFGSASCVISQNCEETKEITSQFIDAIGFNGVYGAEFKRDPRDGRLKIVEVNPRPTLWFHASHVAGSRIVEHAFFDLSNLPLPPKRKQKEGVLWRYAVKDTAAALFYKTHRERFVLPAPNMTIDGPVTKRCWPVFSVTDPLPWLAELYVYVKKYIRRLPWRL
ncbi:MAG: ATP-grasp domain-containing protein [Halioglobus sp.]|nr:ATP-grasp domain-containing protein [Halioglobus sp.]